MDKQAQSQCVHPPTLGAGSASCARSDPGVGAGCRRSVRRGGFGLRPCRKDGACAWERPPRRPANSHCGSRGGGSLVGCARAGHGRSHSGADTHEAGNDLARLAAARDPHPAHVGLGADEAPKLVEFEHIAAFSGQERVAQGREGLGFFSSRPVIVLRPTPKTRAPPPAGSAARWPRRATPRSGVPGRPAGPWGAGPGTLHKPGSGTAGGHRRFCRF